MSQNSNSNSSHRRVMTMDKGRLSTCVYFVCFAAVLITASQGQPTRPDQQQQRVTSNHSSSSASIRPQQIKKDVFMSRGWGAAGMPFNMVYLNHYTKAHKAYAQNLQLQQQQGQREAEQMRLRSGAGGGGILAGLDQPRTLPYGSRYAAASAAASEPQTNAQQSEFGGNNNREDEYADSGVYLSAKPSSPRRQYNVPQLFVSYGWGPMG